MVPTFLTPFLLAFFPALMVLSASLDLLTMTIPNPIPLALAFGYLLAAAALGLPPQSVLFDLSCGLATLAITFVMFTFRWIGGGDAKLAAATALWMGWSLILGYGAVAAIFGGLLAIGLLSARATALPTVLARSAWITRLHSASGGVPYGIALAAAGMIQYSHTRIWVAAVN